MPPLPVESLLAFPGPDQTATYFPCGCVGYKQAENKTQIGFLKRQSLTLCKTHPEIHLTSQARTSI